MLTDIKEACSNQTDDLQHEIQVLKEKVETTSQSRLDKEQMLLEAQQKSSEQTGLLQQQLDQYKETQAVEIRVKETEQAATFREKEALVQEKEVLMARILQTENNQKALEKQHEAVVFEKDRLAQATQAMERDNKEDEIQKLIESQSEKESHILKAEEKLQILQTELSAFNQLLTDKDQHLNTLREEVTAQANLIQKTREEAEAKEKMLTDIKEACSNQTDDLQHEIQVLKENVETTSQSRLDKEQMLLEAQKESSEQTGLLQQQLASVNAELEQYKETQAVEIRVKETEQAATFREKEALVQEKEVLMARILQTENNQKALEKQHEAVVFEKDRLAQATQAMERDNKEDEIQKLIESQSEKESHILEAEEKLQILQTELSAFNQLLTDKDQHLNTLREEVTAQANLIKKTREEAEAKEKMLTDIKEACSNQTDDLQHEIQVLKENVETTSQSRLDKEQMLLEAQQKSSEQTGLLQQQLDQYKETQAVEIRVKETEQAATFREKEALVQEKKVLMARILQTENNQKALEKQHEAVVFEKDRLAQATQAMERDNKEDEIKKLKESQSEKESHILKAEEKLQILQTELSAFNQLLTDKDQHLNTLREEVTAQANLIKKTKEEAEAKEKMLTDIKEACSNQTDDLQHEIQVLKENVETTSQSRLDKEQMLLEAQKESSEQTGLLQQQLASVNAELDQYKETQAVEIRVKETEQAATFREKEALVQEKKVLMARILQTENNQKALEKQHEAVVFEKDRLAQATQAMERDNHASHELESLLQHEVEILKKEKEILLKEKEKADETQTLKKDLQEQLSAKSEAAEHYKAQMEKAMSHYNGKKQLLQESQEEAIKLKQSLEVKECKVNDTTMENHLLQLDLDKAQTNEKALLNKVASLEAQLAFADRNLRAQNKFHGNEGSSLTSLNMEVPNTHSSVNTKAKEKKAISSDSLDYSSMEDSLNNTRKLLAPDESSTPLVRSSERLAAKHRGLQAEYLETLYFTPINSRQINRVNAEHTHKLDSTRKNPTSSVKRRRTTQVINITLTKKTPGDGEHDDTFYSLASARSHPNISSAHSARPVSMTLFDTPARLTGAASDQLIGLPGYRRSTMHSQPASTFYAGDENESDGGTDDWMRIAELQARNKAVLPHLKSSYPVESDPCRGATFLFTDEELRTGDPSDTIRRGSTMPGQLQDSLASHRHSLMVGHSAAAANTRSHRLSLMPELPSKTVSSSQLRSPKGTKRSSSTLSVHQTSPEKKVRASCFPRPLTPKAKNVMSEPFNSQIRTALSPVDRRQSMMFSIDNTPQKNSNFLTKNINKLRSSTRKSPGKTSKKSPAQKSVRKNENNPAADSRAGVARTGKIGSSKSPQVATKGQKATSRSAKSPGLSSARKMMSRMKV
ncbi:hypothetical protein OYC64_007665 [Pagothenia borchgrevinki]|uniref:Nuclear mitotic apparatus protein 1 n=1 Tax=Pagothenia borchgrevinki TaxID=8213 RepID=A0ABD2GUC6_PAGBO